MTEKLQKNLQSVLTKIKFASMPKGEQIETLRTLRGALDDFLYETIEGTAVFTQKAPKKNSRGNTVLSKSGFSFEGSENGISIEVLDYHVGRTFLDWDEIKKFQKNR